MSRELEKPEWAAVTDERTFSDPDEDLLKAMGEKIRLRREQRNKTTEETGDRPRRRVRRTTANSGALSRFRRYKEQRASRAAIAEPKEDTRPTDATAKTGRGSSCPHCGTMRDRAAAPQCPRCRDLGYCECGRIAEHKEFDQDGQCVGAICSHCQAEAVWSNDPQVEFEEWLEQHADVPGRALVAEVETAEEDGDDVPPDVVDIPGPRGLDPSMVAVHDRVTHGERVRPCPECSGWLVRGSNHLRCDECSATWKPLRRRVDWPRFYSGLTWGGLGLLLIWIAFVPAVPWPLKAVVAVLAVAFGGGGLVYALLPRDRKGKNIMDRAGHREQDQEDQEAALFLADALTVGNARHLRQCLEARGYEVDAVFAALLASKLSSNAPEAAFDSASELAGRVGLPGPYEGADEAEAAVIAARSLRNALADRGHDLDVLTSTPATLEPLVADIDVHWPRLVPCYRVELALTNPAQWVVRRPDGTELDPAPSQETRNHGLDGFVRSHDGSGIAQLALAILLDRTGDSERAKRHCEAFNEEVVTYLAQSEGLFELPVREVDIWLRGHR